MSVLLPKDNMNVTKSSSNGRERSPRQKSNSKSQQQQQTNRDSVKIVNEKNAANLNPTEVDDDSESENLSPLLHSKNKNAHLKLGKKAGSNGVNNGVSMPQSISALNLDNVHKSIDGIDNELDERDPGVNDDELEFLYER